MPSPKVLSQQGADDFLLGGKSDCLLLGAVLSDSRALHHDTELAPQRCGRDLHYYAANTCVHACLI